MRILNRTLIATAAAGILTGSMVLADAFSDAVVTDLQARGFERIELRNGPSQVKVEAIRGTTRLEVVYDRSSGRILREETERVRGGEDVSPGLDIREGQRDFVEAQRARRQDGEHRRDDDHRSGRDDDDDDGDDRSGEEEDHGRSGRDDHGGRDNGGSGGHDDGDDHGRDDDGGRGSDDD